MTNIVAKYMSSVPRREVAVVPIYSALTPGRPGTPGTASEPEEPIGESPSTPTTAVEMTSVEMTYKVVKKLLDALPLAERAECLRRLSKDIFTSASDLQAPRA